MPQILYTYALITKVENVESSSLQICTAFVLHQEYILAHFHGHAYIRILGLRTVGHVRWRKLLSSYNRKLRAVLRADVTFMVKLRAVLRADVTFMVKLS